MLSGSFCSFLDFGTPRFCCNLGLGLLCKLTIKSRISRRPKRHSLPRTLTSLCFNQALFQEVKQIGQRQFWLLPGSQIYYLVLFSSILPILSLTRCLKTFTNKIITSPLLHQKFKFFYPCKCCHFSFMSMLFGSQILMLRWRNSRSKVSNALRPLRHTNAFPTFPLDFWCQKPILYNIITF